MIRRLSLTNWRNYANVTIDFEPGTTFVVAVNGIGKTSLVEAARWALFGQLNHNGTAVRAGATAANATVELVLPSQKILGISRDLVVRKTTRTALPEPDATLDGARITPAQVVQLITDEYGTEADFLANVTMPALDATNSKPENLGLEGHLGRFYGVDGLRQACDALTQVKSDITRRISGVKTANATSAQQLLDLRNEVAEATAQAGAADATHKQARTALQTAQQRAARLDDIRTWQADAQTRVTELVRLHDRFVALEATSTSTSGEAAEPITKQPATKTTSNRPADIDDVELTRSITQALEAQRTAVNQTDVRLAVISHSIETLQANRAELDAAHDDCPVCRRPLDEATAAAAAAVTAQDVAALQAEQDLAQQRRTQQAEHLAALNALYNDLRTLTPLPQRPPDADPPNTRAKKPAQPIEPAQLEQIEQATLEALIQARSHLATTQRALSAAQEADEAMRELQSLFEQQARVSIALEATQKTLRDLLDEAVRPMASAVNSRWSTLFPDRGPLHTAADGTVTRTVADQYDLPFDSFSAGEGAGLNLLIRLVVASMATNANFCWFDEPLEHMDPDTRRHVASLLTRAGSGEGQLQQIVLTTYEETLARHLKARDPRRVHLLDVRQNQNTP